MSISPLAHVDPGARIADGVTVGPFTLVGPNADVGAETVIGSHCLIGHPGPGESRGPLRIGEGSVIRSHSVLYDGSEYGPRLETGHHVTLREGLRAGVNLRVGTLSDLQGDMTVGDFVRCHSNVFAAKGTVLGDFVWVFPHAVFTNDPHPPSHTEVGVTVEPYAVIAAMALVLPGLRIGEGAVVSAGAVVTRDVEPGELVMGVPARRAGSASDVRLSTRPDDPAYPWRAHFDRGYPPEILERWRAEKPQA